MMVAKRQYRSRIAITADILEIAKLGSRKTRIMYQANLSFDLLQKYLELLVNQELLEVRNGPEKSYITTETGKQFLEDYHELEKYSERAKSKKHALEDLLTPKAWTS
jgi:predicted transcriptional regulator